MKIIFFVPLVCTTLQIFQLFPLQIAHNNYHVIDLTHTLDEKTPVVPGKEIFQATRTCWADTWNLMSYQSSSGIGTHMDAPHHRIKAGACISELNIEYLVAPCCMLDMHAQCKDNHDYQIQEQDILAWEKIHGIITPGTIVIANTGWAERWHNQELYRNSDPTGTMHFPGFSLPAAKLLLSRGIVGMGIDTFSLDPGNTDTAPVHEYMLAHGVYFVECLANLDKLPATGAIVCSLPLKLAQAPEAPARIIALVPE